MHKKSDVFLSYSSADVDCVRSVRAALETMGRSCWFAPDAITHGEFGERILQAIEDAAVLVLFCSAHSIGNTKRAIEHSKHCLRELKAAEQYGKSVFALAIDDTLENVAESRDFKYHLRFQYNWIDIRPWLEGAGYDRVAAIVSRTMDGEKSALEVQKRLESELIEEAKRLMRHKRWDRALEVLSQEHQFKGELTPLLRIACFISSRGVGRLSKEEADAVVEETLPFLSGSKSSFAAYILNCLLEDYYKASKTHCPISQQDFNFMFRQGNERGRLKWKDLKLLEGIPRDPVKFNTHWIHSSRR